MKCAFCGCFNCLELSYTVAVPSSTWFFFYVYHSDSKLGPYRMAATKLFRARKLTSSKPLFYSLYLGKYSFNRTFQSNAENLIYAFFSSSMHNNHAAIRVFILWLYNLNLHLPSPFNIANPAYGLLFRLVKRTRRLGSSLFYLLLAAHSSLWNCLC